MSGQCAATVCIAAMAPLCLLRSWTVLLHDSTPPKLSSFSEIRSAEMPNAQMLDCLFLGYTGTPYSCFSLGLSASRPTLSHTALLQTLACYSIYVRHRRTLREWYHKPWGRTVAL